MIATVPAFEALRHRDPPTVDPSTFRPLTLEDLLLREFPPRAAILEPWLSLKSLAMVYARRGTGKTWLVNAIALAAASGGTVFQKSGAGPAWKAPCGARVLLVDGEMPASILQRRLAMLTAGGSYHTEGRLSILAADLADEPMPSLTRREGWALVEPHVEAVDVVVFDNISTVFRGLDENDASAWEPVQERLLDLRRRGKAVILVHHGGKNGAQRGTSKREDVLDVVISLVRPDDYDEAEGARFHVIYEKARGLTGRDVESFEASLRVERGAATWTASDLRDERDDEIRKLKGAGKSLRDIGQKVGLDAANVSRRLKRMARREAEGRP